MKIAIVTGTFPSLSESFVLNHVTGLLDEGHDVQVFSNGLPRGRLHPDFDRYGLRERMQNEIPRLAGRWMGLPAMLLRLHARQISACLNPLRHGVGAFSLKALYSVRGLVNQNFDLIHCHFGQNGLAMLSVKDLVGIPLVTSFHGGDLRLFGRFSPAIYHRLFCRRPSRIEPFWP